jgi:hypothetical protein
VCTSKAVLHVSRSCFIAVIRECRKSCKLRDPEALDRGTKHDNANFIIFMHVNTLMTLIRQMQNR